MYTVEPEKESNQSLIDFLREKNVALVAQVLDLKQQLSGAPMVQPQPVVV
jgi:hypothetical protein